MEMRFWPRRMLYYSRKQTCRDRNLVETVMSNFGLEKPSAPRRQSHRHQVGVATWLEEMRRAIINVGGEKSGHMIFGCHHPADGSSGRSRFCDHEGEAGETISELKSC